MSDPRFPLGPFAWDQDTSPARRDTLINQVERVPLELRQALAGIPGALLGAPYREGGWTRRQVVHHLADSHMNAYIRFKLALTEDNPTVKPYEEARWAGLHDSLFMPIGPSLRILEGVHGRWVSLLRSLNPADFRRTYFHPEPRRQFTLDEVLALYAWHGRHHVAHIASIL